MVEHMTKEELKERIADLEWEDFEAKTAKSELPKDIWESVSSFSNCYGGWIVLGVKQEGKTFSIQGVDNIEKLEQDFFSTLRSQKFNAQLIAQPKKYIIDDKKLLAFYIPASKIKPIYYNVPSNTYIRMGSGDQRATEAEINAMFRDQSFGIKTEQFIPMSNFDMVNSASLQSYRSYVKAYNPDRAYPELDDASFCNKIKFLNDNGEISYSCLLMFGKGEYVQQFVPTFALSYLEIPGIDVASAKQRYTYKLPEQDNIWESYLIIMRRLQTVVNVPFGKINHLGVAEHDTSMSDIVREALVNFCQHADFFSPLRSSIHVFLNRIEFLNAGSFPVALNKMVGKFFSMARNPGISKMFRWADLCENEGFGMDELLSWQKITNSKVEIESEREFSRVILYLPENGANLGANEVQIAQDGANLGANEVQTAQDGANLGTNKQRILHAIQIDNTLSVLKLQVLTDIPLRTLQREINELIELGALEKGGTRKNIIWTIKNI